MMLVLQIMASPNQYSTLYPFPVHHSSDRQSQINIFEPVDADKFPKFSKLQALQVHAALCLEFWQLLCPFLAAYGLAVLQSLLECLLFGGLAVFECLLLQSLVCRVGFACCCGRARQYCVGLSGVVAVWRSVSGVVQCEWCGRSVSGVAAVCYIGSGVAAV